MVFRQKSLPVEWTSVWLKGLKSSANTSLEKKLASLIYTGFASHALHFKSLSSLLICELIIEALRYLSKGQNQIGFQRCLEGEFTISCCPKCSTQKKPKLGPVPPMRSLGGMGGLGEKWLPDLKTHFCCPWYEVHFSCLSYGLAHTEWPYCGLCKSCYSLQVFSGRVNLYPHKTYIGHLLSTKHCG